MKRLRSDETTRSSSSNRYSSLRKCRYQKLVQSLKDEISLAANEKVRTIATNLSKRNFTLSLLDSIEILSNAQKRGATCGTELKCILDPNIKLVCNEPNYEKFKMMVADNDDLTATDKLVIIQLIDGGGANCKNSFSPLHMAAELNGSKVMKILLDQGEDAEQTCHNGRRPMHVAAAAPRGYECLKCLIEHGVDINAQDMMDFTALHYVTRARKYEEVLLLLKAGANMHIETEFGRTPFLGSPLYYAVRSGLPELLEFMLSKDVDINSILEDGMSALDKATIRGDVKIMNILLDHGADPERGDERRRRPIHRAAEHRKADCIKCLIEHGANINAQDLNCHTALHFAAIRDHSEVVKSLLDEGADINIETDYGRTPFQLACSWIHGQYYNETAQLLGRLIIKNNVVGLSVNENDVQRMRWDVEKSRGKDIGLISKQFNYNLHEYEDELRNELTNMKSITSISLHDILINRYPNYSLNSRLMQTVNSIVDKNFPEYANLIRRKIEVDKTRYKLMAQALEKFVPSMTLRLTTVNEYNLLKMLPEELIKKILSNLNNEQLQSYILQNSKRKLCQE